MAILVMSFGLHTYVIKETQVCIGMMKFALNHPERFHRPYVAFFVGMCRMWIVYGVQISNSIRVVGLCDVIDIVIGYVSVMALLEIDKFTFKALNEGLPFKSCVMCSDSEMPNALVIERTTSMKNSWANKFYTMLSVDTARQ